MKDKRKLLLRAKEPDGHPKVVTVHLNAADYEKLYWMAFDNQNSLANTIRDLVHCANLSPLLPRQEIFVVTNSELRARRSIDCIAIDHVACIIRYVPTTLHLLSLPEGSRLLVRFYSDVPPRNNVCKRALQEIQAGTFKQLEVFGGHVE